MEIIVKYTNPDTHEQFSQAYELEEKLVREICTQIFNYDGGIIAIDSPLFNLFTSITYLSKLQGFTKTPNFEIEPPHGLEIGPQC